MVNQMWLH